MRVVVAKSAGFCYGVAGALNAARKAREEGPVCTLGALINNSIVVEELEQQGILCAQNASDLPAEQVVVRSHGASPEVLRILSENAEKVIDATCPFVRRIHEKALQARNAGAYIVIIGQPDHPEIVATKGWAGDEAVVVDSVEEALALPPAEHMCVIGQTTYHTHKRDIILDVLKKKAHTIDVFDFICATTRQRQAEALTLAKESDAMIVVGDPKSANTEKLYEIAKEHCRKAFRVECMEQLDMELFSPDMTVAVTAGASTPQKEIDRVVEALRSIP